MRRNSRRGWRNEPVRHGLSAQGVKTSIDRKAKAEDPRDKYEIKQGTGTYWGNVGKYQLASKIIHDRFVPQVGPSGTESGEIQRTLQNFYYDVYNNGLDNADVSGDEWYDFIEEHENELIETGEVSEEEIESVKWNLEKCMVDNMMLSDRDMEEVKEPLENLMNAGAKLAWEKAEDEGYMWRSIESTEDDGYWVKSGYAEELAERQEEMR